MSTFRRDSSTTGVFVDAISARHVTTDPSALLRNRCMTWSKDYGWTFDAWIDDPGRYAVSGANSRFSLPAIAQRVAGMAADACDAVARQAKQQLQQLQPR